MNNKSKSIDVLNIIVILLSAIITISGLFSFNTDNSYEVINQYGENIKIWGTGIYAHDSYFKAPIFIGSDFTVLTVVIPSAIIIFFRLKKKPTIEYYIRNFSLVGLLLYYSASLAFGVTYNQLHLLYIILFGACFYLFALLFLKLYDIHHIKNKVCQYHISNGIKVFLIISGISLFVAWLPDIITSLINGKSLELIEVYTTEITYVLDMGIISPLILLTLYLLKKQGFIAYVLLRMILKVCIVIGIMTPIQTIFQIIAGIYIPIPALLTKVLIFVMLAVFSVYFNHRLKKGTELSPHIN